MRKTNLYSVFGHPHNLLFGVKQDYDVNFSIDCYSRSGKDRVVNNFQLIDSPVFQKQTNSHHQKYKSMFFEDDRFEQDFLEAKQSILVKKYKKAVIYNTLILTLNDSFNIKSCLNKIQKTENSHFVYGLWENNKGFIGLSPEILFQKIQDKNNHFKSVSLAGTLPKGQEETMLTDTKLIQEHGLVTKHFIDHFQKQNLSYNLSETSLEPYHQLVHLKQNISFSFNGDQSELIHSLAPTPAVGMYPHCSLADHWDSFNFNKDKSHDLYGGIFHFKNETQSDAIVMIRNIQWSNNIVYINAGCGITRESDFLSEIKESKNKIASVLELLL